jgi:iron complex outermembrane receptor protein
MRGRTTARAAALGIVCFLATAPLAAQSDEAASQETVGEADDDPTGVVVEASPAPQSGVIDEIVVQARKRDELIQDTPVSVTAVSAATLDKMNATRLDDIQQIVPNLRITTGQNGANSNIRIRGVGATNTDIAFEPGVGLFVDGVFLPRSLGGLIDLVDVEQIEILRGPQGTLFGKNTVGGAVNVTTVKPSPEYSADALVRAGSYDSVETRAGFNAPLDAGPLRDKVFTRMAFRTLREDGYTDNEFAGNDWSNRDSLSYLGSVRILPTYDLTIDVSGMWSNEHSRSRGGQCVVVRPSILFRTVQQACELSEPYDFSADTAGLTDVSSYGTWGTVNWDIGATGPLEEFSLKSISAWREQTARLRQDLDMTAATVSLAGKPFLSLDSTGDGDTGGEPGFQRQISQEFQANASAADGRLNFVAGAFTFWEDGTDTRTVTYNLGNSSTATETRTAIDNFTWALYGQGTWDFLDWASATLGLRYSSDGKDADQRVVVLGDSAPTYDGDDETFGAWTPMTSLALTTPREWLDRTPLDHLVGYFTYARGFKGGGFNAVLNPQSGAEVEQFDPEYLNSYEIGAKTLAFDNRLALNSSLFYGDWQDQQVQAFETVGVGPGGIPQVQNRTLNAAESTIYGAEIEFVGLPTRDLRLEGSLGWLHTEYDEFERAVSFLDGSEIDRSGEEFDETPKLQTMLAAQYTYMLGGMPRSWLNGWITPRLEWTYQSDVFFEGPELGAAAEQDAYHLLHGKLSYELHDDRVMVGLWARNLTDEHYFDESFSLGGSIGTFNRFFAQPRTFGGEISYRF